jgi:hypothetical protein
MEFCKIDPRPDMESDDTDAEPPLESLIKTK